MKMTRLLIAPLAAVALLAGCVTVPTGPAVTVLPGSRKSFDDFRNDDAVCRSYAQTAIGGPAAGQPAADAAAANAAVGAALGAAAGAIIGAATGQAGHGAAIGAGTGLIFGSAAGGNVAYASSYTMQRDYDVAYVQCMYAKGNQVPGRVSYPGSAPRYYAAPPPSAPSVSPPSGYPPPPGAAGGSYPPPDAPPPSLPPPRG